TAYQVGNERYEEFPGDLTLLDQATPVYEWFDGWKASTAGARTMADLPRAARVYLDRLKALAATPIDYVSVGTKRDQIIGVS
ncbi:MAG TPA: adenylosuccinate synthetase, partial [Gemmatimonadaceae bacterium]|nr:adenylosuccinate synthetase [Gemmatimonadaceae bacterium]